MKHVFSITCAAFLSLVLLATSCKKGDTGPEGPAGPAGPNGPQGPKGDTGVANVVYSGWLDVAFEAETDAGGDTLFLYATIPAPKLTRAILDQGQLQAYVNLGTVGAPAVYPLPWVGGAYIDVEYAVGAINLFSNAIASTVGTGQNKSLQYRYVLIPGGKPARSGLDLKDYNAVKLAFGMDGF